jgi:hypothetical protein
MGCEPFVEMRKAPQSATPLDALFAGGRQKVKQIRHFADG